MLIVELFEAMSAVKTRSTAQGYPVRNLQHWFSNNLGAIEESETEFANHRGDLVPLVSKPKSPIHLLTGGLRRIPMLRRISYHFRFRGHPVLSDLALYHNDVLLDAFTNLITVSCGPVMIFAPLWWLNFVINPTTSLAITTGFVTLFTILLSSASAASPLEVLGATAA